MTSKSQGKELLDKDLHLEKETIQTLGYLPLFRFFVADLRFKRFLNFNEVSKLPLNWRNRIRIKM
jgi:hypothetical protein